MPCGQNQPPDPAKRCGRGLIANDEEGLGLNAFDLEPVAATAWPVDETVSLMPRVDRQTDDFAEEQAPYAFEQVCERVMVLASRIVRDRVFRRVVLRAYDERCAITGLKLINGGGRAEVDAAHIRPVEANGPDTVSNGIALSGTAHWMFDRGLIGLSDDLDILVSRQANDPDQIRSFICKTGRALPPLKSHERPHPHFLRWHRENCFKH